MSVSTKDASIHMHKLIVCSTTIVVGVTDALRRSYNAMEM